MEVVEKPFGCRGDQGAFADIFRERSIRGLEDPLVVAQPWVDTVGPAPLRVDREIRRQGERPLIEPL